MRFRVLPGFRDFLPQELWCKNLHLVTKAENPADYLVKAVYSEHDDS